MDGYATIILEFFEDNEEKDPSFPLVLALFDVRVVVDRDQKKIRHIKRDRNELS